MRALIDGFADGSAKPVLVTGAGVSGSGIARLIAGLGGEVVLVDDNAEALVAACADTGARGADSAGARSLIDDHGLSLVVTSPGWRPDSPVLTYAADAGYEVIGDVELAYRLDQAGAFGAPRTWLAVTGTNGKTTTTAMLADIMAAHLAPSGRRAVAAGNIGLSVADALTTDDPATRADVLVVELSSFQLHWSNTLRAEAGVLLNLAEDHLDWHGSMAAYAADKAKVFQATHAIAGVDDPLVAAEVARLNPTGLIGFTQGEPAPGQVGVSAGRIVDNIDGKLIDVVAADGLQPPGPAGVLDALAATAAARTQHVAPETIAAALADFTVSGHRGAVVHRGAKTWIDNSKATNPHAADAALKGFDGGVIWIAGGQLKGASVDELVAEHAHRLSAVGVLGLDREEVAAAVAKHAPHAELFVTDSTAPSGAMRELVAFAATAAGETVLLAPAAASLDMYSGMSQRGDIFAAWAADIDKENR